MKSFGNIAKDGQVRAVASGTLTDGKAVLVNSDGTVSIVAESGTNISESIGSTVTFESGDISLVAFVYDKSAQKVVAFYRDSGNSGYLTYAIGTVSDTSISFSTPVVYLSNAANVTRSSAVYDEGSSKTILCYRDGNDSFSPYAVVGTVGASSITFGTAVKVDTTGTDLQLISNGNGVVLAYRGSNEYGNAAVGAISGNSISFGTSVVFKSASIASDYNSSAYDINAAKVVIAYSDNSNDTNGTAIVGTVSGTSISFGSEVVFDNTSNAVGKTAMAYDKTAQKIVLAFWVQGGTRAFKAVVGTVSGTSISFGSKVTIDSDASYSSMSYNDAASQVVISWSRSASGEDGALIVGTVSGTSISLGSIQTFETDPAFFMTSTYDSDAKRIVIGFRSSSTGKSLVFRNAYTETTTNITSENFIGFSDGAFATTQSAVINTANTIDRNQTSLTPGQTYFVTAAGALSTTAGDPSVKAGTAISSTELIVKG